MLKEHTCDVWHMCNVLKLETKKLHMFLCYNYTSVFSVYVANIYVANSYVANSYVANIYVAIIAM